MLSSRLLSTNIKNRGMLRQQPFAVVLRDTNHTLAATARATAQASTSRPRSLLRLRRKKYLSSDVAVSNKSVVDAAAKDSFTEGATAANTIITRHGSGDGVLTLNVGGKEYLTLRSTVQMNPILWNHVKQAEANHEFTKGGAVFVDRDGSHFGLILQHLRNMADSTFRTSMPMRGGKFVKLLKGKKSVAIQIPKETGARRDLFMEARYYQIKELEAVLCSYDWYTQIASVLGGGSANPFTAMADMFKTGRRMLLATGGTGVFVGMVNEDLRQDFNNLVRDLTRLISGDTPGEKKELPAAPPKGEPSFS